MKKKRKARERLQDTGALFRTANDFLLAGLVLLTAGVWFLGGVTGPLLAGLGGITLLSALTALMLRSTLRNPFLLHLTALLFLCGILYVSGHSGGLQSPFLFLLALPVLLAYTVSNRVGHSYLGVSLFAVAVLWWVGKSGGWTPENTIPESGRGIFATGVLLLLMGLLARVFGPGFFEKWRGLYQSKEELQQKVEEKEMLLKEVHHRVKNNLQTVSSLLRMQGRSIEDAQTLAQIRSSQNRVVCMAMVHEMLYQREDLSCIEYSTYVHQLGDYLVKSIKGPESNIRLNIDIPEIELGIDTAIPLGLLINEAVTNALKYGFEGRDAGEISISLEKEDAQEYVLRIGDDGVGYPENVDYQSSKSLGLKLIYNLSRQLRGSVIRDLSKRGTNYVIRFQEVPEDPFHSMA